MLSDIFPSALPVQMANKVWMVSPLRLRDLAQVESWIVQTRLRAIADDWKHLIDAEPDRRPVVAARLYNKIDGDAVAFPSPKFVEQTRTLEGLALILTMTLRTSDVVDQEGAIQLAIHLIENPEEYAQFELVAFGVTVRSILIHTIENVAEQQEHPPISWSKMVAAVMKQYPAYTLESIGELTLSQWRCLCSDGDDNEGNVAPRPGETAIEAAQRRARIFQEAESDGE